MQHQRSGSFIAVVLSLLLLATFVRASSIPTTVTPDNLVLRDAYGNIIATSLTVALINNTDGGYVQLARALTESGTTFPAEPAVGYLYYRTDLQSLYIWSGLQWLKAMSGTLPPGTISYNDLSDKPDLTVYLFTNATRGLSADWNVTSHGIYDITFLNATAITVTDIHATNVYANTVYLGNLLVDPVALAKGQMWYNSVQDTMKYWNGTAVVVVPSIGGGSSLTYTLPVAYTVYKTGSTYYSEKYDGTTSSSSNISAVVQNAIGNLTSGGSVLIKDAVFSATSSVTVSNNGVALIFENANWTMTASSLNSGMDIFYAANKYNLRFEFRNSWIDCNIANQSPSSTQTITGIHLINCSHVNVPDFQGTGFGSSKCYGFGLLLIGCSDIQIGSVSIYDSGSDAVSLEGSHNVMVSNVYSYGCSRTDGGGAALVIWNYNYTANRICYGITVNSVVNENGGNAAGSGGFGVAILPGPILSGTNAIYDISIGQIVSRNSELEALAISSHYVGSKAYRINIGSVLASNITGGNGRGLKIESDSKYDVSNVVDGQVQIYDVSGQNGIWLDKVQNITLSYVSVNNMSRNGLQMTNVTNSNINIDVYNPGTVGSSYHGLLVWASSRNIIHSNMITCDTASRMATCVTEELGSDYNSFYLKYLWYWTNLPYNVTGTHSYVEYSQIDNGSPYSYMVFTDGYWYYLKNAYGSIVTQSTNKTLIEQYALSNTTSGLVYLNEIQHNSSLTISASQSELVQYQGSMTFINVTGSYQFGAGGATGPAGTVGNQPYSYLVFTNATATYMVSGLNGSITFSSSNASAVIDNAGGNASLVKGSVFIKTGDYNMSSPVLVGNNTSWFGEGYGTHLFLTPNQPNSSNSYWPQWCIFYSGQTGSVENVTIQNIRFDGNWVNNQLMGSVTHPIADIEFYGAKNVKVKNCWIENHRKFGLLIDGQYDSYGVLADGNTFANNQWNQVSFTVLGGGGSMKDSAITNNFFYGSCGDISIDVAGDGTVTYQPTGITISGNIVSNMSGTNGSGSPEAWWGIKLESSHDCVVQNNIVNGVALGLGDDVASVGNNLISGNQINIKDTYTGETTLRRGLEIYSNNNTISNNVITVAPNNYTIGLNLMGNFTKVRGNSVFTFNHAYSASASIHDNGVGDTVELNDFSDDFAGAPTFSGSGMTVRDNRGFVTENWVSGANTTATTIVLNHGCADTVDFVFVSFNFSTWTSWTWTATSTQITITVTGTLPASYTAYAYVKYDP